MAERLKIEGNFLIVFEDGNESNEYINEQSRKVTPRYTQIDEVEFFVNSAKKGVGKSIFDCATLIDDTTGSPWATVQDLKEYLADNLGGFFLSSNQSVNIIPYKVQIAQGDISGASIVNKFAYNLDVDTGTDEVIAAFGGGFDPLTQVITTAQTVDITYDSGTDGLGTTGALSLLVTYIDSSDNEVVGVHTLGNTGSDTSAFTLKGINRVLVLSNGGVINAVNDITLTATTDGTTQALIPSGQSVTQQLIFHTGIGKQFLMDSYDFDILKVATGSGSTPRVTLIGHSWSRVTQTRYEFVRRKLDTSISNVLTIPNNKMYTFLGREVIYFTLETNKNNTEVDGSFGGIILDA